MTIKNISVSYTNIDLRKPSDTSIEEKILEQKPVLSRSSKIHPGLRQCEIAILTAQVVKEKLPILPLEVDTVFTRKTNVFEEADKYANPELAPIVEKVTNLEIVTYLNNPWLRKDDNEFKSRFRAHGFSVIAVDKVFEHQGLPGWVFKGNTSQISCIRNKAGMTGNNKFDHINRPRMTEILNLAIEEENLPFAVPEIYLIKTSHKTDDPEAQFIVVQRKIATKSYGELIKIVSAMPLQQQEYFAKALCRLVCKTGYSDPHLGNMTYQNGIFYIYDEESMGVLYDEQDPNPSFICTKEQCAMVGLQRIIDTTGIDLPIFKKIAEATLIEMQEASVDSPKNLLAYEKFSKLMMSGNATHDDKLAAFNALDEQLKNFISHAIWRASSSPISLQYGEYRFKENVDVLSQISNKEGLNLLQQISIRFNVKISLNLLKELKAALISNVSSTIKIQKILLQLNGVFQGDVLFQPIVQRIDKIEKKIQSEEYKEVGFKDYCQQLFLHTASNNQCLLDALITILSEVKSDLSLFAMTERLTFAHDPLFNAKYDPTPARVTEMAEIDAARFPRQIIMQKMSILLVSLECAQFGLKYGGLGEAVYGLGKGLRESGHQVAILMPKFDKLPQKFDQPHGTITHSYQNKEKTDNVFYKSQEGIDLFYLEDTPQEGFEEINHYSTPSPKLIYVDENADNAPLIPGKPKWYALKKRMAYFASSVAAFVLNSPTALNAVIYNDWHAAGALKHIERAKPISWAAGKTPASIVVLHNQSYGCQGIYDEETADILPQFGDNRLGKNVLIDSFKLADHFVTVSKSFSLEIEGKILGAGIDPELRRLAHKGNLTGIMNGSNPELFDPENDSVLKNWIDPVTKERTPLNYSAHDPDISQKKQFIRSQLQKALEVYYPEEVKRFGLNFAESDFGLFVGRYESSQKGLEMFMPIAKAAHENKLGFITMGIGEDPRATELLDILEKEAEHLGNVWITRSANEFSINMQRGVPAKGIPPLGPIIRAAAAFNVVPSSFEPCGLTQFEGWLFGAMALVSGTGGLKDSVCNDKNSINFNGFIFKRMTNWNSVEQQEEAFKVANEAFGFWNSLTPDEKTALMGKLMQQAQLSSWTTSPFGLTPVEQYEKVLAHADSVKNKRNLENIDLIGNNKKLRVKKDGYFDPYVQPLFEHFGAQIVRNENGETIGVSFKFMAPKAKAVFVVEKLAYSDERIIPMESSGDGSWNLLLKDGKAGMIYEYEVEQEDGLAVRKADPFAFLLEKRPDHGCIVDDPSAYAWKDSDYMVRRKNLPPLGERPLNVYEVHPGSWKRGPNQEFLNYREIGKLLANYCEKMHYTHVELLGILEHPSDDSWGYQISSFYAPTSRYGSVEDFQAMIDHLHSKDIGVILDFVPYHFTATEWGLRNIDGSKFFESSDPLNGEPPHWGTRVFDLKRRDIRRFLLNSAQLWLEKYHLDGLRVDAVSYLTSFETQERRWDPNDEGSKKNLEGITFTRELNKLAHQYPGVLMIAENSNNDELDTDPIDQGGLGFDACWNMHMMHASFDYLKMDQKSRRRNFDLYTKAVEFNADKKNMSEISHDEVVHCKGTLYSRPSGSPEEKIAQARMHLVNQVFLPSYGINTFMGCEFAQKREWNFKAELDWDLMESPEHYNIQVMVRKLNELYMQSPELWGSGVKLDKFEWIIKDPKNLVMGYHRFGPNRQLAVLCNFSNNFLSKHSIIFDNPRSIERLKTARVVFHSIPNLNVEPQIIMKNDKPIGITLDLDAYSTVALQEDFYS